MVIINAPLAFQAVWKIIQPWIHPITRSKIAIIGGHYQKAFDEAGITLLDGATEIPAVVPGWTAEMKKLLAEFEPGELKLGYLPAEDAAALAKL